MRRTLLMVCLLSNSILLCAQKASIKKVEIAGQKIIVHYDLEDSNPANEYQIQLYSSQNNFATALTKVEGDVGAEIKSGYDKKIAWDVTQEIGLYKGKLSLEIRGRMFIPVARISNLAQGDKVKRGRNFTLTWKPGNSNPVNIELLQGGQTVGSHLNQPNNGTFSMLIAPHLEISRDYSFRITDTKDPENATTSRPFAVTRKVPLLLKIVPVLAVGSVIAILSGGGGDGGGGQTPGGEIELPGFPE